MARGVAVRQDHASEFLVAVVDGNVVGRDGRNQLHAVFTAESRQLAERRADVVRRIELAVFDLEAEEDQCIDAGVPVNFHLFPSDGERTGHPHRRQFVFSQEIGPFAFAGDGGPVVEFAVAVIVFDAERIRRALPAQYVQPQAAGDQQFIGFGQIEQAAVATGGVERTVGVNRHRVGDHDGIDELPFCRVVGGVVGVEGFPAGAIKHVGFGIDGHAPAVKLAAVLHRRDLARGDFVRGQRIVKIDEFTVR